MQKLAIGLGVVAMLASTSVFAADLAVKAPPPPPPAVWNWSGFYIGAGGSLNWAHFDQSLERSVTAVFLIRHSTNRQSTTSNDLMSQYGTFETC